MNCSSLRRNLLAAELPSAPTALEGNHLAACPACCDWHQRLVRLEERLPIVPVPACPIPSSLLAQIRSPSLRIETGPHTSGHRRNLQGGRQKLALAFSLAASLAIFAVGWWAWPQIESRHTVAPTADSYETRTRHKLENASTPSERTTALADLADEFLAEARQQPNDPARLAVLAKHFERLVHEDLMIQLRQVSLGEQRLLAATLAKRLRIVESEATRLASAWQGLHANSVAPLQRIAASAREADRRLSLFV